MDTFKWKRFSISPDQYTEKMEITKNAPTEFTLTITQDSTQETKTVKISPESLDLLHGSKHLTAYNIASDIRKFEISLFWQRAAFFWAFIVAIYTAYYHVLTKIYDVGKDGCPRFKHGSVPLLVLSALGLFFCFSWLLASKGSRHWQENWENHLDLLEDNVTGSLYKTYEAGKAYSVSKIVITAGWIVTMCAYGLLVYEFVQMLINSTKLNSALCVFYLSLAFAVIIAVLLYVYSVLMIGNTSDYGEFKFQTKVHEE